MSRSFTIGFLLRPEALCSRERECLRPFELVSGVTGIDGALVRSESELSDGCPFREIHRRHVHPEGIGRHRRLEEIERAFVIDDGAPTVDEMLGSSGVEIPRGTDTFRITLKVDANAARGSSVCGIAST